MFKKIILFSLVFLLLSAGTQSFAKNANYTYTYDYWGEERESPDAYQAYEIIGGKDFGIGSFRNPEGMYVIGNQIYICDTGNNRIVELKKDEMGLELIRVIDRFEREGAEDSFLTPMDIFVDERGQLYVCDTGNQRIVHLTKDLEFVKEITKPLDETVDQAGDFLPIKAVVDQGGRVLTLVKNYNKGFLQFKNTGEFVGYIGANEVKFDMLDYIWKSISTKEQRAQMTQFVPTEYNNLSLDKDGFIYCTTSVFEEFELLSDKAKPIRKLNSMGADILIKNGNFPPIGDVEWGNAGGISGPSKLIDVVALDNQLYYALDRSRGRIFAYDTQGNLLYAFGGIGNQMGYFQYPVAIDHMEEDLLVLDGKSGSISFFQLTPYGNLINQGIREYEQGNYDQSAIYWEEVLTRNGNYDLAYIGIGRSYIRQGRYKEAMDYFQLKNDDRNYSKAFKLYRKEWIENNIAWIFALLGAALILPPIVGGIQKIKREVERA